MRLEVTNAELQQRLSKMNELEKELEHHRYVRFTYLQVCERKADM